MEHVVPPSFLFEYRFPVPRCAAPGKSKARRLLKLPDESCLFVPAALNGIKPFADIACGWNEDGFALQVNVSGRSAPAAGRSSDVSRSDAVLLWLDTRPTGTVHRATEYCHHFAILPADENQDGDPSAVVQPIAQQRHQRVESDVKKFRLNVQQRSDGYLLEAWLPGSQLHGWRDVTDLRRVGFYVVVQDTELGDQPLSIQDDFPVGYDPSTWATLELQP